MDPKIIKIMALDCNERTLCGITENGEITDSDGECVNLWHEQPEDVVVVVDGEDVGDMVSERDGLLKEVERLKARVEELRSALSGVMESTRSFNKALARTGG